jgi:hypothetical protein
MWYESGLLPGPQDEPARKLDEHELDCTPNHIDDIYLELSLSRVRGPYTVGGLFLSLLSVWSCTMLLDSASWVELDGCLLFAVICTLTLVMGVAMIRYDIQLPRDEPIRFNRIRRRVYVYLVEPRYNPFAKGPRVIRVVAFDWDSLRAKKLAGGRGTCTDIVKLEVIDSCSGKKIDDFYLARVFQKGPERWMLVRAFMQMGPNALPVFSTPARDWNNEKTRNPIRQIAPKVEWPPEVDAESRTVPDE